MTRRSRGTLAWCVLLATAVWADARAADPETGIDSDDATEIEKADADIMELDVASSIVDAVNIRNFATFSTDVRGAYAAEDTDLRNGGSERDDEFTARLRAGGAWNLLTTLRLTARAAFLCSTESCDPQVAIDSDVAGNSTDPGELVIDEFFLQWFQTEKFDVAAGRLQTRFVTRGGIFAKSLDRNNSHNTSVNWTDGLHATIKPGLGRGWVAHLISEYNDDEGTGSVRRAPLDFSTSNSSVSHFIAFENTQSWRYLVQRGLDVSYLPDALLKDGEQTGRRDDYWGIVGRTAARVPLDASGRRLQLASEIGYAPKTPTNRAVGIGNPGDADGLAWNVSASLIDFIPKHSIGILYAQTGAGWLLSPQFASNEEQYEVRWQWRPEANIVLDARVRQREELEQLASSERKEKELDYFVRLTWRYSASN